MFMAYLKEQFYNLVHSLTNQTTQTNFPEKNCVLHISKFHYVVLAILLQSIHAKKLKMDTLYIIVPQNKIRNFEFYFPEFTSNKELIIHDTIIYIVYESIIKKNSPDNNSNDSKNSKDLNDENVEFEHEDSEELKEDREMLKDIYELPIFFDFNISSSEKEMIDIDTQIMPIIPDKVVQLLYPSIQKLVYIENKDDKILLDLSFFKLINYAEHLSVYY